MSIILCGQVQNLMKEHTLRILDGENRTKELIIKPGHTEDFNLTPFPWVNSEEELYSKAFRAYYIDGQERTVGLAHIFQNYSTSRVCWSPWNSVQPLEEKTCKTEDWTKVNMAVGKEAGPCGWPSVEFYFGGT